MTKKRQILATRDGKEILLTEIGSLITGDEVTIDGYGKMTYAGNNGQLIFCQEGNSGTRIAIGVDRKNIVKGNRKSMILKRRYVIGGGESGLYKEAQRMIEM